MKNKQYETTDETIKSMEQTIESLKNKYDSALSGMESLKASQEESIQKCEALETSHEVIKGHMDNIGNIANTQSATLNKMNATLDDMNKDSGDILNNLSKIKANNQLIRKYVIDLENTNKAIKEECSE